MSSSFLDVSYFCTVGKGLEEFCVTELSQLGTVNIDEITVGKVFFNCCHDAHVLVNLKTIERLFVSVLHVKQFLSANNIKISLSKLTTLLQSERVQWRQCLYSWLKFQGFESDREDCEEGYFPYLNESCFSKRPRYSEDDITFRVNCRTSGHLRKFNFKQLCSVIASSIIKCGGWKVELRNPKLEVYVHACDSSLTIGFPVTNRPLSDRYYLKHIALRPTVCHAMLLAIGKVSSGSILLDPMCGAGTLAIEAALYYSNISVVAADVVPSQLDKTKENVLTANVARNISVVLSDAARLPFKQEFFNIIVCDLPFGRNHSTEDEVKKMIPEVLLEMNRVLFVDGKVALLISCVLSEYLKQCVDKLNQRLLLKLENSGMEFKQVIWVYKNEHIVKLGELKCVWCHTLITSFLS